jgi:hypothetical protein
VTSRRSFLLGFGAALAAPAIVRAESLMPLFVPKPRVLTNAEAKAALNELMNAHYRLARDKLTRDIEQALYFGTGPMRDLLMPPRRLPSFGLASLLDSPRT